MLERFDAVVIGGGQAGLATSCELNRLGIDHVVLERARIGQTWRDLWESFCLVTPNWSVRLPGHPYDGDDPDGFMPRDEIVAYLERYATAVGSPIREGVDVATVRPADGGFLLDTSGGDLRASSVVIATGTYARPHRPHAETLPSGVLQIDVRDYDEPSTLPEGAVLIIGSGQSGCQLAEELHQAGRDVVLSCGKAPWFPRRLAGRDLVWWAAESGFLDAPLASLPDPSAARLTANPLASGHGGGHDLHLRTLAALGVRLRGHFLGAEGGRFRFADDLAASVAWGDEWYGMFADLIRKLAADRGMDPVDVPDPEPFVDRSTGSVDVNGFGTVIYAGGFRPDFGSLVPVPGAFDDQGFPVHADGHCTVVPGLFFVGVHFLRKRKSSILYGVGEDARIVAAGVAARARS